ncbi:MAG TPA: bifunctional tRNA (5-methylaminomethyl-2-thiouridine)(34)-methyltransferase MnmD/FAD-dependent 5-carboxymethylaminomethyl-2-thiouridine(34) oxidoreductase MnmC [Usitatibacter sp.]|jgi:tRNA 5-methylaminomethyl-2-thiouridine biosynthesis bifunctional protein|nr:bifunctional tRNA (5-methylaminomethyl-2-thiouridine)(34)-methyltransferase MnmD/FAD-dependent 5-carboxymethylaminomethyl-2-thiouridine(34) oxidoreductase MnmC [Usitatibacter sp.]
MTARSVSIPTAHLTRNPDGVPYSEAFGDVYHSTHGGLAQARYVFLEGNGLPRAWSGRSAFTVLETGFGLGLSFLAAWDAWRNDPSRCARLHFISVEGHPLTRGDLAGALEPFGELRALSRALVTAWPPPLAGFHRMHFDGGAVILTLLQGDVREVLPQLVARADALFLDGFSPARNPGMWSPEVVRELARLASPGATLATWTVAGGVRSALAGAGFAIEKREGFAGKREMLVGHRAGTRPDRQPAERRAVVVGGGLAGTLAAERIAARGWHVELVEARAERDAAAVGLVRPVVNLRDAVNAQASRSAFLYALQHYRGLDRDGYHLQWRASGVLQLAQDADEAARFEAIVRSQGYPAEFLSFVEADRAREIADRDVRGPGWWFPSGAWVSPASLAVASLARAGERVRRRMRRAVARLEREGASWRALDADDRVIAEAPVLILANAADAKRLIPQARLPLSSVRGQVTYLPRSPARRLEVIVSGTGYVAPVPDAGVCVGASYHHDDEERGVRDSDHRENLGRAEAMLPGFTDGLDPASLDGWTGFRTTVPDRLPVFGACAVEGLYTATGLGSRGLLWSPLGAELLACELEGEPCPLPRDLAGAISPRRFLS